MNWNKSLQSNMFQTQQQNMMYGIGAKSKAKELDKKQNSFGNSRFMINLPSPISAQKKLSAEQIKIIQEEVEMGNNKRVQKGRIRNVLVCGKTRGGKTTLMNVLQSPTYSSGKLGNIFSDTKDASLQSFILEDHSRICPKKNQPIKTTINIVDTPGLFDRRQNPDENMSNDKVKELIDDCLRLEVTYVHIVVICVNLNAGITDIETEALTTILEMFDTDQLQIYLMFTHVEDKTNEHLQNYLAQLSNDVVIGSLIEEKKIKIAFGGYVNTKKNYFSQDAIKEEYNRVVFFRNQFLDILTADLPRVALLDLPMSKTRLEKVGHNLKELFKLLQTINKVFEEEEKRKKKKKVKKEEEVLKSFDLLVAKLVGNVEEVSKLLHYNSVLLRHYLNKDQELYEKLQIEIGKIRNLKNSAMTKERVKKLTWLL